MATVNLVMPKMGESIMEATILKWHKQPGDHVNRDETVLEIATDKVDTEVPSTADGVVEEKEQLAKYGSVIRHHSNQLTELVNQILLFASTHEGRKTSRSLEISIAVAGLKRP